MEYLIGAALALAVGLLLTVLRMDRDRSLYTVIMIVIASYYELFAAIGGSAQVLVAETAAAAVFVGLSIAGFKSTLWLVVAALAGHGVFDLVHGHLIENTGVPAWWPAFCLAYDVIAAGYLALLIVRDRIRDNME